MNGNVNSRNEAVLPTRLRGPSGVAVEFPLGIDTGFDDYLAVTPLIVKELGLRTFRATSYVTADGTHVNAQYYAVEIEWLGRWMKVPAIEIEGGMLLGMGMFSGCLLTLEVVAGGRVTVEKLSQVSG
jgi:clan AA aspartic protease